MKIRTYLICFVLIVVGCFCGIRLYQEVKAESYINGSIDITNKFSQESFNYSSTSVVFNKDIYDDTNTYYFDTSLLKVNDFDGVKKQYQVKLNDYALNNTEIKLGSIFSVVEMDFYNTDGKIVCNGILNISIQFLSDKSQLKLTTIGLEQSKFFEQYFKDNGIRLKVLEIL